MSARNDGPDFSGRTVLWLSPGWQPAHIGFAPSRAAWSREMRKMGVKDEPWTEAPARTTRFKRKGQTCIIVSVRPDTEAGVSRIQIAGLLAHEATHVWQYIKEEIGETNPGWEVEAYSVQAIFQSLYQAWFDVRGHAHPADERSAA